MKNYKKEFGDYQTPIFFTDIECEYLKKYLNVNPQISIEPTCGAGIFLNVQISIFQTA